MNSETSFVGCYVNTDSLNNLEMVVIPPNSGASFTVYVSSKNFGSARPWNPGHVASSSQPYAIFTLNAY